MGGYVDDVNISTATPSRADASGWAYGVEQGTGWVVNMKASSGQDWLLWVALAAAAFALWRSRGGS
jgi:hypothetical protein